MSGYMLISADDYSICTEQFDSYEAARKQMLRQVREELYEADVMYELARFENVKDANDYYDEAAAWDKIKDLDEYNCNEVGFLGFGFNNGGAVSSVSENYITRWKIVQIF